MLRIFMKRTTVAAKSLSTHDKVFTWKLFWCKKYLLEYKIQNCLHLENQIEFF